MTNVCHMKEIEGQDVRVCYSVCETDGCNADSLGNSASAAPGNNSGGIALWQMLNIIFVISWISKNV